MAVVEGGRVALVEEGGCSGGRVAVVDRGRVAVMEGGWVDVVQGMWLWCMEDGCGGR